MLTENREQLHQEDATAATGQKHQSGVEALTAPVPCATRVVYVSNTLMPHIEQI